MLFLLLAGKHFLQMFFGERLFQLFFNIKIHFMLFLFLLFAAHRLHLLIPAFLLQGLHCKESADCNDGQVVNNTANVQNTVHKVIHMACHVEYTEQILDFALEKGGFCEVNCRQTHLRRSRQSHR